MPRLHFELYEYGDPYLQFITDDKNAYTIEQGDKFELRYTELNKDTIFLGHYDTIYEVLDAANYHYIRFLDSQIIEDGQLAVYEDKFIMPERRELEVFEDNQPFDRPPCKLYTQNFDGWGKESEQLAAIIDARGIKGGIL